MDLSSLLGDDEDLTPLYDAEIPRVDLVSRAANGVPRFLLAKSADDPGLLGPEFVRSLIGKEAEPDRRERVTTPSGLTLSGSPADIAAFIHKAAQRAAEAEPDDVAKAELSSKAENDLPDSAFAFIEDGGKKDADGKTAPRSLRHFNISDAAHVRNALARASSSPFGDKAMGKIRAAAKRFGVAVSKEAGVPDTVTKDAGPELDDSTDGMDPAVPLAAPDGDAPGDPADPGSPAWEAIDAATARKWTSIAVRLKNALCVMADREMLEAAAADPSDADNAFDLEDAQCALDYVIDTLAGFAVGEQAEADLGGEAMEAIGKALAGCDPGPLDAFEGLCAVVKAGRVLSSANEAHIREAAARLTTVLSSLPQAPATDDGQPVAKTANEEADMPDPTPSADVTAASGEEPAMGARGPAPVAKAGKAPSGPIPVADGGTVQATPEAAQAMEAVAGTIVKADGEKTPMMVVYNQAGKLVGICDPSDITPVANAEADPEDAGDDTPPADAAPDADPADMTPAPPAETGTPAAAVPDDGTVTKSTTTPDVFAALESAVAKAVAAALDGRTPHEDIAKQGDVAGLLEEVETLKARLATVEEQPAAPKVFTNGAVPPANMLRGQDQGAGRQVDVAKAAEMRARFRDADPVEQNRLANEMQQAAIGHLAVLHGRN